MSCEIKHQSAEIQRLGAPLIKLMHQSLVRHKWPHLDSNIPGASRCIQVYPGVSRCIQVPQFSTHPQKSKSVMHSSVINHSILRRRAQSIRAVGCQQQPCSGVPLASPQGSADFEACHLRQAKVRKPGEVSTNSQGDHHGHFCWAFARIIRLIVINYSIFMYIFQWISISKHSQNNCHYLYLPDDICCKLYGRGFSVSGSILPAAFDLFLIHLVIRQHPMHPYMHIPYVIYPYISDSLYLMIIKQTINPKGSKKFTKPFVRISFSRSLDHWISEVTDG